jgi:serine beta-lactamase-like protein LACTB, mitochondrial
VGLASKELNAPVTRQTKFRIGNTTQIFTAALIAKLHEEGILHIDSSFYDCIPHFPKKEWDFSLRMLGTHTAGWQQTRADNLLQLKGVNTLRDYVKTFDESPLVYKPNTYFLVSDFGTALLGIAAEQVTGKRFNDLLKEKLLDTLGLKNTVIDYPLFIIENRSSFYTLDYIARLINAPAINLAPLGPVHGMLSTADDMNVFGQQFLNPGYFSKKTINLFFTPQTLSDGYLVSRSFGWMTAVDKKGREVIAQIGNTIGGSSAIVVCPKYNLVVSVCSNKDDATTEAPAYAIAQVFLNHIEEVLGEIAAEEAEYEAEQDEIEAFFGTEE